MIFFIRQLQYYCHLEVIACSWQVLEDFAVKKEGDLDSLIEAHRAYLHRLVTKALLISPRRSSKRGGNEVRPSQRMRGARADCCVLQPTISMLEQVRKIFKILLQYREAAVRYFLSLRHSSELNAPPRRTLSATMLWPKQLVK